jgi:uncharacterized membrane protein HdeD (DUF308 family)
MERVVFVREPSIAPTLKRHWSWLVVFGALEILAGIAAVALPVAATFITTVALSWVLLFAGALHIAKAVSLHRWRGFSGHLWSGVLYLVTGGLAILYPATGALSLALVVASLLVADGIVRSVYAVRLKPMDGWSWMLASGIASAVLGVMLLATWPSAGLWALGLLLGVNLIFGGAMNVALGINCYESKRNDRGHWVAAH